FFIYSGTIRFNRIRFNCLLNFIRIAFTFYYDYFFYSHLYTLIFKITLYILLTNFIQTWSFIYIITYFYNGYLFCINIKNKICKPETYKNSANGIYSLYDDDIPTSY